MFREPKQTILTKGECSGCPEKNHARDVTCFERICFHLPLRYLPDGAVFIKHEAKVGGKGQTRRMTYGRPENWRELDALL